MWPLRNYEVPKPNEVAVVDPRYKKRGVAVYAGAIAAVFYLTLNEISPEKWSEFIDLARWVFCFGMAFCLVAAITLLFSAARREDRVFYIDIKKVRTRFVIYRLFDVITFTCGWLAMQFIVAFVYFKF